MTNVTIDDCLRCADEIYRDVRFQSVRDWKRTTGGLAIGYLPVLAPRELLHGLGALPVGLMGGGGGAEVLLADAHFQSYICHLPRSVLELGLRRELECLDGVLFPAACDVIRNLSGMWRILFPETIVRYLDFPQDADSSFGREFLDSVLRAMVDDLVGRGARKYDEERLRASLRAYNENRRTIAELYRLQQHQPWRVPASEFYRIQRAGLVLPVEEYTRMLRAYEHAVQNDATRHPLDQARVLLASCFCEQPPVELIRTLEQSGCYIVDDDLVLVQRGTCREIPEDGDPWEDYLYWYLAAYAPSPFQHSKSMDRGQALVERVRGSEAEGVIFCAANFCHPALLEQPLLARALDHAGIPWTAVAYSENTGQFRVVREQAGTFADSLRLWSEP